MRVLIPTHPRTSTGYPKQPGAVSGGLETACLQIIDSLVSMGHEVTLYTDDDFIVEDPRVEQVKGGYTSRINAKVTPTKKWTEGWIKEASNPRYERVVLNDAIFNLSNCLKEFREVCKKVSVIYHLYDEQVDGSFLATQIQSLMEVAENGGKVFSVSPTLVSYLEKKYPNGELHGNPYFLEDLTKKLDTGKIRPFRNGITLYQGESIESNEDFMFLGRAVKEKKALETMRAFEKSSVSGRLKMFVAAPNANMHKNYYDQLVEESKKSKKTDLIVDAPRSEILECFRVSSVLIFPSVKESFGMVPLEAASFGMRIIHKDLRCPCYEEQDYHLDRVSSASLKKAIEGCPIPSKEEKMERVERVSRVFSKGSYKFQVEQLLE